MKNYKIVCLITGLIVSSAAMSQGGAQNAINNGKPFGILQSEIDAVAASVEELEDWVADLQGDFNSLDTTVAELLVTVEGIEVSVENQATDISCPDDKLLAGIVYQNDIPTAVCVDDGFALGDAFALVQINNANQYVYAERISCPTNHMLVGHGFNARGESNLTISRYHQYRENVVLGLGGQRGYYELAVIDGQSGANVGFTVRVMCAPLP